MGTPRRRRRARTQQAILAIIRDDARRGDLAAQAYLRAHDAAPRALMLLLEIPPARERRAGEIAPAPESRRSDPSAGRS
jgi:hypothetical protein